MSEDPVYAKFDGVYREEAKAEESEQFIIGIMEKKFTCFFFTGKINKKIYL